MTIDLWVESCRIHAIKKAKEIVSNPDGWVILDSETTGLYQCEAVELAVIDGNKKKLLNSRIKPNQPIEKQAIAIHKISNKDVESAPKFEELYPILKKIVNEKTVLIYNAAFDTRVLDYACELANLPLLEFKYICVMHLYAEYYGSWHSYHQSFTWQKLPGGNHSALGDCLAVHALLEAMSKTDFNDNDLTIPISKDPDGEMDDIPF
jgi:DNA polymerase-3 subunit epsilon